jgi:hypothetical protein
MNSPLLKAVLCALVLVLTAWPQTESRPGNFEYASVRHAGFSYQGSRPTLKEDSTAEICYFTSDGCRIEAVKIVGRRPGSMMSTVGPTHAQAAAAAKLGEEGWDLQTTAFDTESKSVILFFRRSGAARVLYGRPEAATPSR